LDAAPPISFLARETNMDANPLEQDTFYTTRPSWDHRISNAHGTNVITENAPK
jgi:hypothetical protein